jgi:hypothetical protein
MATIVFLDTNNWIYLSNGFNIFSGEHEDLHFKVFDIIEKRVADGSLVFLVNDIVLDEFERNKATTQLYIKELKKKVKNYINTLKELKIFTPTNVENIDDLIADIKAKSDEKIALQTAHIARLEDFIKTKTKKISITDEHKVECTDMAVAKRAPFIGDKKNSAADALLLVSAIDHIVKNEKEKLEVFGETFDMGFPKSFFVSSNAGDFSHPNDKKVIHPDLEPILARSNTKFYYSLNPLVTSLEKDFLTKEEFEFIEEAEGDDWIKCEVCENLWSRIEFGNPTDVFDPNKVFDDPNQLEIFGDALKKAPTPSHNAYVAVRLGRCDYCSTDYVECPNCNAIVNLNEYNTTIECTNCEYKFRLNVKMGRKGDIEEEYLEIVQEYICENCGETVDGINEEGLCGECGEYEKIALE